VNVAQRFDPQYRLNVGMMRSLILAALAFSLAGQDAPRPAFEVISVKAPTPESRRMGIGLFTYAGGRIHATNYTLKQLIHDAYNLEMFRILGGPHWLDEDRFEVEAKPAASSDLAKWIPESFKSPPNAEMRLMLQTLLADRFQLKAHFETRQESIYSLVVSKGGQRLHVPADKTAQPFVSFMQNGLRGTNATIDQLIERIARILGRPVLNHTGIQGNFDFNIVYSPEEMANNDGSTLLLSAIQEQLGLKLETQPGSVEVLVVESAAKPSEN
jgi:uncharacterized protein (TIGR03435 family)